MDTKTVNGHPPSQPPPPEQIALAYNNDNGNESALRLVYAIKPKWREGPGEVEIKRFTDGITNTLLKLVKRIPGRSDEQIDEDAVLLRAYGNNTEILIDRDREAASHALLAARGLAPALLARFNNGLLYRYIQGRVCTPQDLISEPVWRGVARRLAEWHGRLPIDAVPDSKPLVDSHDACSSSDHGSSRGSEAASPIIASRSPTPNIWAVMQKWVQALPVRTEAERARKGQLQNELDRSFEELDDSTSIGDQGLVFGHCDLLSANVIILPSTNKDANQSGVETVKFIDYEYATPCPAAFDIANHFAEWGGYDCDYNMLPNKPIRWQFLDEYLKSFASHTSAHVGSAALPQLADEVDRYRGMPGLYWGIWALIQATISKIDFDYASYAEVRLGEYWAWRAETDGSRKRAGKVIPLRERRWAEE